MSALTGRATRALNLTLFLWFAFALLVPVGASDAEYARVLRVLDGDSLRLSDGREVRLIGINAPEFGRDGAPDQPLARAARGRAAALLQGAIAQLRHDTERFDRHRRTLAYLHTGDGRDVQEILLREGLAWFVAVAPNVARLAAYRAAETEARLAGRGIWALAVYEPKPAERLSPRDRGFRRIAGKVQAVSTRGGTVILRLSDRVHLAGSRPHFPADPDALTGKRVIARGWLSEYKNTLRMRITHAAMLELAP